MVDYPRAFELEPITDWPGQLTTEREVAKFRTASGPTKLSTTMRELQTEMDALKGTRPTLAIAILREDLRLDGKLRAGAKPWHPGVILSFDTSKHGTMRYANDRFTRWEDNLRGIVKELEALRGITRWVNNGGQQYGGFLAIEAATPMPAAFHSRSDVERFLWMVLEDEAIHSSASLTEVVRRAKRAAHPDRGGTAELFHRVNLAEQFLRETGAF